MSAESTSRYQRGLTIALTRSRGGRDNAIRFLDMIAGDAYQVERVRKSDEERAMALVRAHEDKDYSLCDALSFVVMERLRLNEAVAFDRHFRAYGRFTILSCAPCTTVRQQA